MRAGWVMAAAVVLLGAAPPQQQPKGKGTIFPPDREPTPEETLILEYMNRFRANPSAEADLMAPPDKKLDGGVDWKMFRDEMKQLKPMPPLAFSLELLDAARKHSVYMIHNGLGHLEEAGKEGFTGASPGDRVRAAGYKGGGGAENAFRDSGGPWSSHIGYVVDNGEGPGGMQPERGHRRNMIGAHREAGPGGVPHGEGRLSVTHNFGSRDVRMAGGVVFIDLDGNKFYDIGEGLGGVTISSSDGASTVTWRSGAFALELKGMTAVTLTASIDGEKVTKAFSAGRDNVKFDFIVPLEVPFRKADRYLEAVYDAGDEETPKRHQALVNLYVNTRGLLMDVGRRKRVAALTTIVGSELDGRQQAVLEALKDVEAPGLQKLIEEGRKPYKATDAEDWFNEAEMVGKLKRGVAGFLKQPKPPTQERRQLATALEDAARKLKVPSFRAEVDGLVGKVRAGGSEK